MLFEVTYALRRDSRQLSRICEPVRLLAVAYACARLLGCEEDMISQQQEIFIEEAK